MAIIMELVSYWSPSFPQDLFPVPILCWVSLGIQINFFFKSTLLLNWTYTKWPGYIIWTAFEGSSPYTTTAPKIKRMHSKFEQETAQSEGCRVTDALPLHISPSGCLFFGCCCFFCVFRNWFVWDESCSATRSHCTMLCMSPLIRINSRLVSSSNLLQEEQLGWTSICDISERWLEILHVIRGQLCYRCLERYLSGHGQTVAR